MIKIISDVLELSALGCWKLWEKFFLVPNTNEARSILPQCAFCFPRSKKKPVAKILKAIHTQESKKVPRENVVSQLIAVKLKNIRKKIEDGIERFLTYCAFPAEHWTLYPYE